MRLVVCALALLGACSSFAEEAEVVPTEILRKALEWMKSEDPERRKAAYSTMQLLDESALPQFQTALLAAKSYHEKELGKVLTGRGAVDYLALEESLGKLSEERARVLELIRTDYQKDPAKKKMLRNEVDGVAQIYEKATRLAEKDLSALDKKVNAIAGVIGELSGELARIESHREGEFYEPNDDSPEEQRRVVLEESYDGERYLKLWEQLSKFEQELLDLQEAGKENAGASWAKSSQKDFANHLNGERAVMGLEPLVLEEKLSDAATGHSTDMGSMGFFAHESPIEEKSSPAKRANLADYGGRFRGENIYMGSSSPASAYSAWFGSDGHRFIMFSEGPDELGIGPVGRHWTMMTGKGS